MLFKIVVDGTQSLGNYPIYDETLGQHQPNLPPGVYYGSSPFGFTPNPEIVYGHTAPHYQLPFDERGTRHEYTEYTYWFQYTIYEAFYSNSETLFPAYIGETERQVVDRFNNPTSKPPIKIENGNGAAYYAWRVVSSFPSKANYYRVVRAENSLPIPIKPNYKSLVNGYYLDNRKLPKTKAIIPSKTQKVQIGYYRDSGNDPFKAIEWMRYELDLTKGIPYYLPITNPTLGTFYCEDDAIKTQIKDLATDDEYYPYSYLFGDKLSQIFSDWNIIYQSKLSQQLAIPSLPANSTITNTSYFYANQTERILRAMGGNNDVWNNKHIPTADINKEEIHPLWIVDDGRSYDWWFAPQDDNSYGTIIMHNPKIDEIRDALNAGHYSTNEATGESRVANIGHLVEKVAYLLGYRPEPDGTLDHQKEKALVRTIISKDKPVDPAKVGVTSFGESGMTLTRLNNSFSGKDITANECVLVRDLPQLLGEYQDQLNLALGLQESSAISVENSNGTAKYHNQLGVLVELLNLATNSHDMIRSALVSSLVAQGQTTELIAAMGLPSVTKTIPVEIDSKMNDLPYKGVAAHRSISQEIAVCAHNIGIVSGQLI